MERHAQQVRASAAGKPMPHSRFEVLLLGGLLALAPALLPPCAQAQPEQAAKEYTPHIGQSGKDVVWVPTPQPLVERMLDMAKLTARDIHYDLGSGDGRTVITAAKRGATSFGVEFNPDMVVLSQRAAAREGVTGKATFIHGDIFQTDFSKATVVTLYLLPSLNVKLRPTLLRMKPGTRVVSHAFDMDDWKPDQTADVEGSKAFLWIVPARIEGTWRWNAAGPAARPIEITLKQHYQQLDGTAHVGEKAAQLRDLKLDGDQITFSVFESATAHTDYTARVNGNSMTGTMKHSGAETKWSATRSTQ